MTYTGYDEAKDEAIIKAAGRNPAQTTYDPTEARHSLDFTFAIRKTATAARNRIVATQREFGGFSVSKVINDSF